MNVRIIINYVMFFLSILSYCFAPTYPSRLFMGCCVLMGGISIAGLLTNKGNVIDKQLNKIYLRHSVIFVISFIIVYYQYAIDYVIGLVDSDNKVLELVWVNPSVVSKATALSSIAITSFAMGYFMYRPTIVNCERKYYFASTRILCYICYGIIFSYLLLSGFGADPESDTNRGLLIIFQAFYIATITILCYNNKNRIVQNRQLIGIFKHPLILCALYVLVVIATGKRTAVLKIVFLIALAYSYFYSYKKFGVYKLLLFAFISMFIMAVVGVSRGGVMTFSDAFELIRQYPSLSPATMELAGSVNTVHVALNVVPDEINYNWGSTFFEGFTVLIPGLSRLKATIASSMGSEEFITQQYFGGDIPDWGWGFGSSSIADVYISFGPIGVSIAFIVFGMFLKYLEKGTFLEYRSPFFLTLSFCVYSQIFSFMRGPFSLLFLSLSYAVIIVFLLQKKKCSQLA